MLGLPPFEHSEVGCSIGALGAAIEIRKQLEAIGLRSHAAILMGKIWIGAVGNENRREYVAVGEPMQLATQMLGFTTDEQPVLVDVPTSQANTARYNFTALSISIRVPGQFKSHTMLAVKDPRPPDPAAKTFDIEFNVGKWLQARKLYVPPTSNLVSGQLSDSAKQQTRECFKELDQDQSGSISTAELLTVLNHIDADGKLGLNIDRIIEDMDHDSSGSVTLDEFLATAAAAVENDTDPYCKHSAAHNLPLLLTAYTTRRHMQHRLGADFTGMYKRGAADPISPPGDQLGSGGGAVASDSDALSRILMIKLKGEDAVGFEAFSDAVRLAEPNHEPSERQLRKRFQALDLDGNGHIDRREYARGVLFERVSKSSSRAVELFVQWDVDRSGTISRAEFRKGVRALGLTEEAGFKDADVDAIFKALDRDSSGELDYNELATTLVMTKGKAATLARLKALNASQSLSPRSRRRTITGLVLEGAHNKPGGIAESPRRASMARANGLGANRGSRRTSMPMAVVEGSDQARRGSMSISARTASQVENFPSYNTSSPRTGRRQTVAMHGHNTQLDQHPAGRLSSQRGNVTLTTGDSSEVSLLKPVPPVTRNKTGHFETSQQATTNASSAQSLSASKQTVQALSDETDAVYADFQARRRKVGPLRDPSGRLRAILSPRIVHGIGTRAMSRGAAPHPPFPSRESADGGASQTGPSCSPRSAIDKRPTRFFNPPYKAFAKHESDDTMRNSASSIVMALHPRETLMKQKNSKSLLRLVGSEQDISSESEVASPCERKGDLLAQCANRHQTQQVSSPASVRPGTGGDDRSQFGATPQDDTSAVTLPQLGLSRPRGKFIGPPAPIASAPLLPSSPRHANAPPSRQLPPIHPPTQPGSPRRENADTADGEPRWGPNEERSSVEAARLLRLGTQRDHHEHFARSMRGPSAWQKRLRRIQRLELLDSETTLSACASQLARMRAFRCLRNSFSSQGSSQPLDSDMGELGDFGNVGLGIGSRPTTPADEKAMHQWVAPPTISASEIKELNRAARIASQPTDELSADERRAWLLQPQTVVVRTSVDDILEEYGLRPLYQPTSGSSTDAASKSLPAVPESSEIDQRNAEGAHES